MSEVKPTRRDEAEAEFLDAKAALLDAIEELRREAANDAALEDPLRRVHTANRARWRAHAKWQHTTHLVGRRYGELVVVELLESHKKHKSLWLCRCDCGGTRKVRQWKLANGDITHCGTCHSPYLDWSGATDLVGRRYGKLVVVDRLHPVERANKQSVWLCQCDCGGVIAARGYRLHGNVTTHCGCSPSDAGIEALRAYHAHRLADEAIKLRDETLAAGGRPCARCGAPLRSDSAPVCRRCVTAAKTKARLEDYAA